MTPWSSLYLPSADAAQVAAQTQESLTALGYTLYNPFGVLPGKAYPHTVRLFVAPSVGGWVRVIGIPDAEQLPLLSRGTLCLWLALADAEADIAIYQAGAPAGVAALAPYLRSDCTIGSLSHVLDSPDLHVIEPEKPSDIPVLLLPDEIKSLAADVDSQQAQSMFERLTKTLFSRTAPSGDVAKAAQALIHAGHPPQWNSPGGNRIRALMGCLTMPPGWNDPDFVTLRDAYQVHERRQRNPHADLYPGDAEAMAHVMNALDYVPVYGGRS